MIAINHKLVNVVAFRLVEEITRMLFKKLSVRLTPPSNDLIKRSDDQI